MKFYISDVRASGREFSDEEIVAIQQKIDGKPSLSRRGLSREVCEELGWRSIDGRLKEMSCRVALSKLEHCGKIRLNPAVAFAAKRRPRRSGTEVEATAIDCRLDKLQPIELVRVANRGQSQIWNELMERYHPLGSGPLCGAQLRYLIRGANGKWLGGMAFSAASWRLQARDQWIGWSTTAREQNLNQVAGNTRFMILPHVRVPHLASHVLSLAANRLQQDWQQRYGYELLLLETFVDTKHYRGTCYRAANWIEVGQTQGRGRQDVNHNQRSSVKRIFVYALDAQAKQRLCAAKLESLPESQPQPERVAADWAEEEFGNVRLGHERLKKRLLKIARDFYARPQAQIPQACQSRAGTKAAYRFFQHPETTMEALLEPHIEASQQRIAKEKIVLAVQDTTSLNYSTHPATNGLGPIGSSPEGIVGLIVHDTMAFSPEGTPLGLLDVQCWARNGNEFGKKHQRKQRPIEQKESHKWLQSFRQVAQMQQRCPQTTLVSVGDREADIYELFHLALEDPLGPKLLVRAEQDRLLADGQGHLWSIVEQQPLAGIRELRVPRGSNGPAGQTQLEIRFAEVTLKPPNGKARYGSLTLWAVLAQQINAQSTDPLCWMLLTTCRVDSFDGAIEKLNWYTKRWCIEIYHRTLKSGCKIEERQLGSACRIEACLAIDMVVAWRVYHLTKLGREVPDVPCSVFFEEAEWIALTAFITKDPVPPAQPPSLREALRMLASLGGFLGRKGDGDPGTKSLWLGLQRLDDITATAKIYNPYLRPPPVSSASSYG